MKRGICFQVLTLILSFLVPFSASLPLAHSSTTPVNSVSELLETNHSEIDVAYGALVMSEEVLKFSFSIDMSASFYKDKLDAMMAELKAELKDIDDLDESLRVISKYLFDKSGLKYNSSKGVLRRPKELFLPFTLSNIDASDIAFAVVYSSLAKRVGIEGLVGMDSRRSFKIYHSNNERTYLIDFENNGSLVRQDFNSDEYFYPVATEAAMLGVYSRHIGRMLQGAQKNEEAREYLKYANELDSNNPITMLDYGKSLLPHHIGETAKAEALLIQATEHAPDFIAAHTSLITWYLGTNKRDKLEKRLEILRQKGEGVLADSYHGVYHSVMHDYEKAIEKFKKVIEKEPNDPNHQNNLALAYLRSGQSNKAKPHLEKIISDEKFRSAAILKIAPIYISEGNAEKAINLLKTIEQDDKRYLAAQIHLASTYLDLNDMERMHAILKVITKTNPQVPDIYILQGYYFIKKNKANSAKTNFKKAIKLDPKHAGAHKGLGLLYAALNKDKKAGKHLKLAHQYGAKIPDQLKKYLD